MTRDRPQLAIWNGGFLICDLQRTRASDCSEFRLLIWKLDAQFFEDFPKSTSIEVLQVWTRRFATNQDAIPSMDRALNFPNTQQTATLPRITGKRGSVEQDSEEKKRTEADNRQCAFAGIYRFLWEIKWDDQHFSTSHWLEAGPDKGALLRNLQAFKLIIFEWFTSDFPSLATINCDTRTESSVCCPTKRTNWN